MGLDGLNLFTCNVVELGGTVNVKLNILSSAAPFTPLITVMISIIKIAGFFLM